jgi:aspartyl protease family protein
MTDIQPGEASGPVVHEHSFVGRVLVGVFLILAVAGGWVYQFRPHWLASSPIIVAEQPVAPAEDDKPDVRFDTLYRKYSMNPLTTRIAGNHRVDGPLATLQKEPCDRQAVFQTTSGLEALRALRGAAEMLKGFADICPDGDGERYHASELLYLLGDYDMAIRLSSELIDHRPDVQRPYFLRARSEQNLKQYAAAIEDYTTFIRLLPNAKVASSEVFSRMSDSYEKLDQPCEAIGPIQTYIALDNEKRSTPQLLKRIVALAAKGNCAQIYAKGTARIPRRASGVVFAKVEINGIQGAFIVDTGASFVTLSKEFADKAKPRMLNTDALQMQTASGITSAALGTVDSIKLAGLSASNVPAVMVSKGLGDGTDGLLGMSFLSRFNVVMQDRDIQLKAKSLEE